MSKRKRYINIIVLGLLIGFSTNIAHPVTPGYLSSLGVDKKFFGYCFSAMSLGMLLFAPIWGSFGDIISRKYSIIICFVFYGIGQIMFALFKIPLLIIFARFFAGCFSAGINVNAITFASNSFQSDDTKYPSSKVLSNYVAFLAIGASIGYLVGGYLGNIFDYNVVILIQGLFCIIMTLYIFIIKIKNDNEIIYTQRNSVFSNFKNISKLPLSMGILMFGIMIVSISQTILSKYTDAYIADLGYASSDIGNYMFVVGIVTLFVNFFVTPIILKKVSFNISLIVSTLLSAFFSIITFIASKNIILMLYTTFMFYSAFKAMYDPIIVNKLKESKEVTPGILLGIKYSFSSLGQVIGPIVAGIVYDINSIYTFYLASILLVCASIIFLIYSVIISSKKNKNFF